MKKFYSILLCVAMLFSFAPQVHGAENSRDDMLLEEMAAVFEYTGIYTLTDGGIPANQVMTRGDFAVYAARALKLAESSENVYFVDVSREHSAVAQINALAEIGYISRGERSFRPHDPITLAEAAKLAVCAAGYTVVAEAKGGFPSGYIDTARQIKILPACKDNNQLTHLEAMMLLFNAMATDAYNMNTFSDDGTVGYAKSEETMFDQIWDIQRKRGTLTAYYGGSLDGEQMAKDTAKIDGEIYDYQSGMYLDDEFANEVNFVAVRRDDDKDLLIYVRNTNNGTTDRVIDSRNLVKFDENSYTISYLRSETSGTVTETSLARNAVVYYNGAEYTDSLSAVMEEFLTGGKKGSIRIKNSGHGNINDIVIIKSYRNIAVNQVDSENNIYYNLANTTDNLVLSDYQNVTVRNTSLIETTLKISDTTVLTVAEAKDKSYLEIIVCNDVVNGSVQIVKAWETVEGSITVSGREIKIDSSYPSVFPRFQPGQTYKIIVDPFGYIAYSEISDSIADYTVGLLIDCRVATRVFSTVGMLKIFSQTGEMNKYDLASRVILDGKTYSGDNSALQVLANIPGTTGITFSNGTPTDGKPVVQKQAIRYRLDDEGKIREIDTTNVTDVEDPDSTLTKLSNPYMLNRYIQRYTTTSQRMGASILYNGTQSIILRQPHTDTDGNLITVWNGATTVSVTAENILDAEGNKVAATDDMYAVGYKDLDGKWAIMEGYKFNPSSPYTDIILVTFEPYIDEYASLLFDHMERAVNEQGEIVDMVACYNLGTYATYEANPADFSDMETGDLFRGALDPNKKRLSNVSLVYDASADAFINGTRTPSETDNGNKKTITPDFWYNGTITIDNRLQETTAWGYYNAFQLTKGKVVDKKKNVIFWDWDKDYTTYEECLDFTSVPLMVIESDKTIRKGTAADAVSYKSAGSNASRIVMFSSYMIGKCGYLYADE